MADGRKSRSKAGRNRGRGRALAAAAFVTICLGAVAATAAEGGPTATRTVPVDSMVFETPPPPFRDPDIFPCSQCHNADMPPNPQRRKLTEMHEDIVLRHDEEHRWCLDCHDAQNRDRLHLANGTLIPFEQSYKLCGQCHGDKYRDWRAGVHGRRTGMWNGKKQYLLCVHCHYSHEPKFKGIKPLAPPIPPGRKP